MIIYIQRKKNYIAEKKSDQQHNTHTFWSNNNSLIILMHTRNNYYHFSRSFETQNIFLLCESKEQSKIFLQLKHNK